jgi:AAA ATPase domain
MSAHAAATGGLLERDMELQLFSRVIERAERGRGGVVLIEGQAGVGKTELLRVAGSLGEAARLRVLRGRGTELDCPFGFGVVRQLLERCARESPAALVGGAEAAAAVSRPRRPRRPRGSEPADSPIVRTLSSSQQEPGPAATGVCCPGANP